MNTRERLDGIAAKRILVLDGGMGSMIQRYALKEADFRGSRFANHSQDLAGCSDILCLTKPEVIAEIHTAYLEAGADIIETCSFGNGTAITLGDYGLENLAYEISRASAEIAKTAARRFSSPDKPRFAAGSMGPLTKSSSLSPDIQDPGKRGVYWDEMTAAYYDNARGLLDGGVDLLIIETIFDTLNAKAAIFAVSRLEEERGVKIPLMISASVSDAAGRLLSGQNLPAFCVSVLHAEPWSIGLNCSLGAARLKPYLKIVADFAPCLVSAHPNAGMPNEFGLYDDGPEIMAACLEEYMREGLVNIVGGCCGSTPEHIKAIAEAAEKYPPRPPAGLTPAGGRLTPKTCRQVMAGFAGLEPVEVQPLIKIGERTNVAGSRLFLKLIREERYEEALGIAREMIDQGAHILNVCMDDPLLDGSACMTRFLTLALSDPDIARVPIMLDSSRWETIETGLKLLQGKGIVNSISLKDGETEFLRKARLARRYGAAIMVMLFDEQGQAATYARKIEVAGRAYRLLVDRGFPPESILFDAVVLTIATGIPEHDRYALDFIDACRWIHDNCPGARVSGGIANLSFSFQGNEAVRNAMHSVLLKHGVDAGLSLAIVNPGTMIPYDQLDPGLRTAAEDLILCRKPHGAEEFLQFALSKTEKTESEKKLWRQKAPEERIIYAMIKGIDEYIEEDVLELRPQCARPLDIIEGPLMRGMREVGDRFAEGKLFLPQVIRSARVMQKGVNALSPYIQQEKTAGKGMGKILLATVKGDVHDIGKNFVGVVLGCNGCEVLDLGVMVPAERIAETALREEADIVGLSGLITPSLDEMIRTAREMERRGLRVPLLIGGATTSLAHTALRIAPEYSGPVVYISDASRSASAVRALLSPADREGFLAELRAEYRSAADRHARLEGKRSLLSFAEARRNRFTPDWSARNANPQPAVRGVLDLTGYSVSRVAPYLDWAEFLRGWDAQRGGPSAGAETLLADARNMLARIQAEGLLTLRGAVGFFPGVSENEDVLIFDEKDVQCEGKEIARFSFLRDQRKKPEGGKNLCLADFIPASGFSNAHPPAGVLPCTGVALPRPASNYQQWRVSEKTGGGATCECGGRAESTGADAGPETTPLVQGSKAAGGKPAGGGGWVGVFALSAGFGLEAAQSAQDEYGRLLLGTLANALTDAFAEEVHLRVRREWWGYAPDEDLSMEDILAGKYAGLRPAIGYPVCPDHQDKRLVFTLLGAEARCGFALTESGMIIPGASVCGLYFANPSARYFGVGAVGADQMQDWAVRKGIDLASAEKRLANQWT